jgi:hypothetical protein
METAAERVNAPMPRIGLAANAPDLTIVQAQPPDLSTATGKLLEVTLNLAVRVVSARAPLVATTMAARPGPFRHAEAQVWAAAVRGAAADLTVAAGVINQGSSCSRVCEI